MAHTLCEPAQSKCMSRFHKSHFMGKKTEKKPRTKTTAYTLREPAQSKRMSRFHKSHFMGKNQEKKHGPKPRPTLCVSLRSRNACQDFTRATLCRNLKRKCHGPKPRPTFCASLRNQNACQDFTRTILCGNSARDQSEHPDQAPAFTPTIRTPQCGHCAGEKQQTNGFTISSSKFDGFGHNGGEYIMFIHFVSKPLLFLASLLSDQNCKQVHIHRLLSVYRKRGIFQHSTLPYCEFTERSQRSEIHH